MKTPNGGRNPVVRCLLIQAKGGEQMGSKRMDPSKQFSKKLATWTAVFWFVYMAWLSAILIIQPQTAQYVVYMALITTAMMVLNVWAYTRNSIYEKAMLTLLDKTKLELSIGAKGQDSSSNNNGEEDDNG